MSGGAVRGQFLYSLPSSVLWEFCRVMDGLSDLDWTRFASEVLRDQTAVRFAERRDRRTDWVMNQWESRNGRVGDLIDLLEFLHLFRPRDVILDWASRQNPSSSAAPPPPLPAPPPPPPPSMSLFDPPPKEQQAPPTMTAWELKVDEGGGRSLPRPEPPPLSLKSDVHHHHHHHQPPPPPPQRPPEVSCGAAPPLLVPSGTAVMSWSMEEVRAQTQGFSPALQVGEGGFGLVYRASLRDIWCAVKRLRQDSVLNWNQLEQSFQTEVEKLSKFRHPNIVDLLGFSVGGGSMCLIYRYMENRSLEDQLHNDCGVLSWSQRLAIVEGASSALQFLHRPPEGQTPLIHGDVKSSNILLDRHLEAKLSDFGLARFMSPCPLGPCGTQTASIGKTATVRGTLAYLPDEYVRNGELGTAVDVFSFGVVLLEVLTGRRALERHKTSGDRYLKDLVEEVEEGGGGSLDQVWRNHVDQRLVPGGAAAPPGCLQLAALASRSLDKKRKRRPTMTQVFIELQSISSVVRKTHSSPSSSSSSPLHHTPHPRPPSQSFPRPPRSLDSSVGALSTQLSKLGPLEDTYQLSQTSSSSSSFLRSLTPPHPLHSSSSLPPSSSSSLPPLQPSPSPSSSFPGPCETDESRGFSQYDLRPQTRSNGTRSSSPSSRPSVPTEDQYQYQPAPPPGSSVDRSRLGVPGGAAAAMGPDTRGGQTGTGTGTGTPAGLDGFSPAGSLQSSSPGPSVHMNPSKLRLLAKKTWYEEGRIQTPELLSSDGLYEARSSDQRGPEESDELDYLPVKHH